MRTVLGYIIFVLICCFLVFNETKKHYQGQVKEIEVPESPIINLSETFNLNGIEHTKQIINGVKITSYNNHVNQTDDTPNITATNRPVREGIIAVSRDFLTKGIIKYGDLVYIDCFDAWYVAEDTMHERFNKHIDIFLFDKNESLKINKTCNIQIVHITR